jgi:hypothetical protein
MKIYLGGVPAGWEGKTLKETEKELAKMGAEHRMISFAYQKHAETLIEVSKELGTEKKRLKNRNSGKN